MAEGEDAPAEERWVGGFVLDFAEGDPEFQQLVCGTRSGCSAAMWQMAAFDYVGPRRVVRARIAVVALRAVEGATA